MNDFKIVPHIVEMTSSREFCSEFSIDEKDLFITSEHIWNDYFKNYADKSNVVFLRDFGSGEPTDLMVDSIYESIKDKIFSRVIAVGGGSVLDVAKLFCLKYIYPVDDLFEGKLDLIRDKKLIMIPTTCGTGSEVTNISILELTKLHTKKGLVSDKLYADYAVLIPELLESLPYKFFATSSMDALIHAMESFLSPRATTFSMFYSKTAIRSILKGYITICQQGEQSRHRIMSDFLVSSTYAGIAFGNAGCGAVHALSYPLGAKYHIPHGESNYAVLKGIMVKYKETEKSERLGELECIISKTIGCAKSDIYTELFKLLDCILSHKSLCEYGVAESDLDEFAESVYKNQQRLLLNGYTIFSKDEILEIYKSLYMKG